LEESGIVLTDELYTYFPEASRRSATIPVRVSSVPAEIRNKDLRMHVKNIAASANLSEEMVSHQ
jgi:hypothetical protein